ncbi:MAG: hypothetical protein Q9163_002698 [Psora crenata]
MSKPPSPDDGFDYNRIAKKPESEPTRLKEITNPPPVDIEEPRLDPIATANYEDQDCVFTQTSPHIFQRRQGGWNAKLPEVDLEKQYLVSNRTNGPSRPNHGQENPLATRGGAPFMPLELTWVVQRIQNKRKLTFTLSHSDCNSQDASANGAEGFRMYNNAAQGHVHDPDVPRRILWQHCFQASMSISKFLSAVSECRRQGLSDSEYGLAKRLTTRLSMDSERPFIGGRYLMPWTLRYDNQDVSKYTVDKTCIFFNFPYLYLASVGLRKYYDKGHLEHPPRTLLQSHYRLNKTQDRDKLQCVKWLKGRKLMSFLAASEDEKLERSHRKTDEFLYVPQLWGMIVGLDTLITSGCSDVKELCQPAIEIEAKRTAQNDNVLSLGLLNKQQQLLEIIDEQLVSQEDPKTIRLTDKTKPGDYHFWRDDDGLRITFENWGEVLREAHTKEMLSIRMRRDTPTVGKETPVANNSIIRGEPQLRVASSQEAKAARNTPAFLEWPMQDEFGENGNLPVQERVSKFLRAIHLRLPVPSAMTAKERAKRPQAFSEKRAQANDIYIPPKSFAQLQKDVGAAKLVDTAGVLIEKCAEMLLLFIPSSLGVDFQSDALRVFWGAVWEILQEAARVDNFKQELFTFMASLDRIIASAAHLHRGVHCLRNIQATDTPIWVDEMADGAVLLSAIVDAFGSIFHMFIEAVRYIKCKPDDRHSGLMSPSASVSGFAKEALKSLGVAKDQLIREADGKDNNDTVGPVLTPEAVAIALMDRLVSGVYRSGTIDIIGLYEECLEYLTLQVKYEASRRLLQKINEFSEEVAIVNDILKQQNNVLLQLRSALDPETFRAPSVARKLRYQYECKGIDKILLTIKDQLRACAELLERAKQLSIENVQLVETLQDDNSKAIFLFTMVTILFLPLSFVAGFFGMNLQGITDTTRDVWHFWKVALPLTAGIIGLCTVVAIKGEDTYFVSARLWRYLRRVCGSQL